MLIKKASDIRYSEITPKSLYLRRREFLQASAAALVTAGFGSFAADAQAQGKLPKLPNVKKTQAPFSVTGEAPTSYDDITSYNNFYEFASGAGDGPKARSGNFKTAGWKISVEGEVVKPASYTLEEFIKPYALEERIYRLRCVETWSAIVPWVGFTLKDMIARLQPTARAKYIEFTTLYDTGRFPQQRTDSLQWPYVEGLTMAEAQNPLAILAVGLYGEVLPNQNGAPIRLVVPWKYGFKSVKSIVKIKFTEKQPRNTWQIMAPNEYGFYANVNPQVDHPRWSQARERRLGEFRQRPTLMFNGYGDQVASLYSGLDLRKNF